MSFSNWINYFDTGRWLDSSIDLFHHLARSQEGFEKKAVNFRRTWSIGFRNTHDDCN